MLGPNRPEACADDSQFWGQTILNQYRRVALSPPDPDISARVSVFRALNRMKRFRRFRALCEAIGLGPGEGIGEADAADWWLRILLMPQEFHDELWRSFPEYLAALRMASAEVATRMALVAEAATTTARRKKDIIVSQADQIADLRRQVKTAAARKRLVEYFSPGKRSKGWQKLRRIVRAAARHVWIEDNYVGSDVVAMLAEDLPESANLRVLGPVKENKWWDGALASLRRLGTDLAGRVEVRVSDDVHERYIYVRGNAWRSSDSFKDMAARKTTKITDEGEGSAGLIANFRKRWKSAKLVFPP